MWRIATFTLYILDLACHRSNSSLMYAISKGWLISQGWGEVVLSREGPVLWTWIDSSPSYFHYIMWDEITYAFPNFHSYTVEGWDGLVISFHNFCKCDYLFMLGFKSIYVLVKGASNDVMPQCHGMRWEIYITPHEIIERLCIIPHEICIRFYSIPHEICIRFYNIPQEMCKRFYSIPIKYLYGFTVYPRKYVYGVVVLCLPQCYWWI